MKMDSIKDISRILRRLWNYFIELPFMFTFERSLHNRSIVRAIGTALPLSPAPRICIILAAWNPELDRFTNERGCEVASPKQLDIMQECYTCHDQIEELQKEMKVINDKLAELLLKDLVIRPDKLTAIEPKIENKESDIHIAIPPPPPPPPMPDPNFTSSKPPLFRRNKKHITRYSSHQSNDGPLHLVLSQLAKEKPKLRHVERSPGGRPLKPKREPQVDPCDILSLILKKRYAVIQDSSDAESFNNSFNEITSPIKTALC